ncbi:MAG: nucleotidyltransferase family protein [Sedimentisphaerales bacterium]|nr:nucleotidyltransferase family protein [Sedimentisphaerales bacterium]
MMTKQHILKTLAENKDSLRAAFKVRRLGLFGSYARGDQRQDSDVDILVEVDPSIGLDFVALCETFERLLGTRVDVVSSRAIRPSGWKEIEGELIYV